MDVTKLVEQYTAEAIDIRRRLHQNPELGDKEFKTTALIIEELTKYGVEIEECGLKTGVSAIIRGAKPGKTIAIREDIDALPIIEDSGLPFTSDVEGICHSCGHDIHTAVLLLCARVLAEGKSELCGNVRLFFQPSEEIGTGALQFLEAGVMKRDPKPDSMISLHTSPDVAAGKVGLKKGPSNASFDTIDITVKGVGGHGAHPYRCVDSIMTACYMVTQMQTVVSRENPAVQPAVLSFCAINGGNAYNILPPEVTLKGTLRTFNHEGRKKMNESIKRIATLCCETMRAEADVKITRGAPPLINDVVVIDAVAAAAVKTIGAENVVALEEPTPGSDDFAYYLELVPGAQFRVGTWSDLEGSHVGLHNPKAVFDEKSIAAGAKVMTQYIVDALV